MQLHERKVPLQIRTLVACVEVVFFPSPLIAFLVYWFVSTVGFYSLSHSAFFVPGLCLFSLFPCLQPVFVCYVLCFIRSSVLSCFPSLNLLYPQHPLECVMDI